MKLRLIARRYAQAFVSYAREAIGLKNLVDEAKGLKIILQQNPEFQMILLSPEITTAEKFEFVDKVLRDYFSQEMILLVKLVVEKRRAALLTDILDYIRVNYSHDEAAAAVLKSAYPLDLEVVEEIKQKLEAKTGKRLYFYQHLDATILGGVQVTIGNTIIDGSLRKRLDDLKEKIDMLMVG